MIYRKLKDYIHTEHNIVTTTTVIFGDLMSIDCKFWYDGKIYQPCNRYNGEMDFLLEYYVVGIRPEYEIKDNKIIPYLSVTLRKNVETLEDSNSSEANELEKRIGCPLEVFVATALGIYDKEKDKSK